MKATWDFTVTHTQRHDGTTINGPATADEPFETAAQSSGRPLSGSDPLVASGSNRRYAIFEGGNPHAAEQSQCACPPPS